MEVSQTKWLAKNVACSLMGVYLKKTIDVSKAAVKKPERGRGGILYLVFSENMQTTNACLSLFYDP